jgi:hypothetical protein
MDPRPKISAWWWVVRDVAGSVTGQLLYRVSFGDARSWQRVYALGVVVQRCLCYMCVVFVAEDEHGADVDDRP